MSWSDSEVQTGWTPTSMGSFGSLGLYGMPGHKVRVTIWDANGQNPTSYTLTVPIDEPLGLRLAPGSDSGVLGDNITNVGTPVITGTGDPNDIVTLYDGNTVVGTGVVLSGGSWSLDKPAYERPP